MAFVYILKNNNGRYYIGSTINLQKRMKHHKGGYTPSTKKLGSMNLIFYQEYPTLGAARKVETKLKKFKRKDFITKIIKEGKIKIK